MICVSCLVASAPVLSACLSCLTLTLTLTLNLSIVFIQSRMRNTPGRKWDPYFGKLCFVFCIYSSRIFLGPFLWQNLPFFLPGFSPIYGQGRLQNFRNFRVFCPRQNHVQGQSQRQRQKQKQGTKLETETERQRQTGQRQRGKDRQRQGQGQKNRQRQNKTRQARQFKIKSERPKDQDQDQDQDQE
jgi:hypothetical protein